jgi:colanic acid/amylovoran biosynthesis protein
VFSTVKRILIGSFIEPYNNGEMAILTSLVKILKELLSDVSITVMVSSPEVTRARYKDFISTYNLEVIAAPWFKEASSSIMTRIRSGLSGLMFALFKRGTLHKYDLYLELGTDSHTDYYGRFSFYADWGPLFICMLSKMPFVLIAETVGPFRYRLSRFIARFVFRRASLITVRDTVSLGYLQELGIDDVHLVSDLAFLLEPASGARIDAILAGEGVNQPGQPMIGIAGSQLIHGYAFSSHYRQSDKKRNEYIRLMARTIDYLVEKTSALVLLIAHVDVPRWNDKIMNEEIYHEVENRDNVRLIKGEYATDELKGIISRCQMFIGCRMHADIAATSLYVPTLAISYSQKFQAILGSLLDKEKCFVDITQSDPEEVFHELCSKIDYVWENKESISQELKDKMLTVKAGAHLNAELIKKLLDKLPDR